MILAGLHRRDALELRVSLMGDYKLSRNFRLSEMQSKDGSDLVLIHPGLLVLLQKTRDKFGPIRINSGYRSPLHNSIVGGSENSFHIYGMACDIVPLDADLSFSRVRSFVRENGGGAAVIYDSFIHVDVGPRRDWKP